MFDHGGQCTSPKVPTNHLLLIIFFLQLLQPCGWLLSSCIQQLHKLNCLRNSNLQIQSLPTSYLFHFFLFIFFCLNIQSSYGQQYCLNLLFSAVPHFWKIIPYFFVFLEQIFLMHYYNFYQILWILLITLSLAQNDFKFQANDPTYAHQKYKKLIFHFKWVLFPV